MVIQISLKKGVWEALADSAMDRILNWFFAYPEDGFTLNDLCKVTNTAKKTANMVVEKLVQAGFLEKQVYGKLWRLSARKKHPFFVTRKIPTNLRMVYESGILDALLQMYPQARSIILFGSYRKGDDIPASDIDVAVELPGKISQKIVELGTIRHFGYRHDVKVNVYIFSRSSIDNNVFANIANGIVLWGFLEVKP